MRVPVLLYQPDVLDAHCFGGQVSALGASTAQAILNDGLKSLRRLVSRPSVTEDQSRLELNGQCQRGRPA